MKLKRNNGNDENKRIIWFKLAIYSLLFSGCQVTSGGNQTKTEEIVQINPTIGYRKNNCIKWKKKKREEKSEKNKYQRWTNVRLCDRPQHAMIVDRMNWEYAC